jgi:hypothetical protein
VTTQLAVLNFALRLVGDREVTQAILTARSQERSNKLLDLYDISRASMFSEHAWNFAIVRTTLYAYTEPATTLTPGAVSGNNVTFTAGAIGTFFVAGVSDVGKVLAGDGVPGSATIDGHSSTSPAATLTPAAGALVAGTTGVIFTAGASVFVAGDIGKVIKSTLTAGIATITAQGGTTATCTINEAFPSVAAMASGNWTLTSTTVVTADITTNFASTGAIASGAWRLYNVTPNHEFGFRIALPSDLLRFHRASDFDQYQREGQWLITDVDALPCRYIADVDEAYWPGFFTEAFAYKLAMQVAEPITGKLANGQNAAKLWEFMLRKAKGTDGVEGSTERIESNDLIGVRYGGSGRSWSGRFW